MRTTCGDAGFEIMTSLPVVRNQVVFVGVIAVVRSIASQRTRQQYEP